MDELHEQLRIREMEWKLKKERIQKEKEKQNHEKELLKEKRVQQVRQNQSDLIEKKRKDIIDKQIHHDEIIEKKIAENNDKIEKFKQEQQEKRDKYQEIRKTLERETNEKNQRLTEKLRLSDESIMKNMAEIDVKRRKEAIIRQILLEEKKQIATRLAKQKEAMAMEATVLYEERLKKIDQKEQMKRKNLEEAGRIRIALEKERSKVMQSASSNKDIIKNSPKQLQKLADQLGINLSELQEKAKQISRGARRPVQLTSKTSPSVSSIKIGGTPRRPTSENVKGKTLNTSPHSNSSSTLSSNRINDNNNSNIVVKKKSQPIHGMNPIKSPTNTAHLNTTNRTIKNTSNNINNEKNKPMPKLKTSNH